METRTPRNSILLSVTSEPRVDDGRHSGMDHIDTCKRYPHAMEEDNAMIHYGRYYHSISPSPNPQTCPQQ